VLAASSCLQIWLHNRDGSTLPRDPAWPTCCAAGRGRWRTRAIEDILPLSPLQEGMLFHHVFDEDAVDVYTVQLVFDLAGTVDRAALRAAAGALLERHANLRAAFRQRKSGEWVQVVLGSVRPNWTEVDLSELPAAERTEEAIRFVADDRVRRFDLGRHRSGGSR
jgi:hypothetical protein